MLIELIACERTTVAEIRAAAEQLGIGQAYCYRLLRRLRADPTVTAVVPRPRGRSHGAKLLSPDVEAIIETAIDDFYLQRNCPSASALLREIARRCV